jgi:hypothetical protein
MPQGTLRVPALKRDAERPGLHSHAERGNDQSSVRLTIRSPNARQLVKPGGQRLPGAGVEAA